MLINYIILAHNKPRQLERLVKRLDAVEVFFYIHIDKSVDDAPFRKLLTGNENIYFLEDEERTSTPWSDIGFVHATLAALKRCIQNTKNGYCVLLSGQDYPIAGNQKIRKYFETNYGKSFISIADVAAIWPHWEIRFERYNFHLVKKRTEHGIYPLCDSRFLTFRNLKDILFVTLHFGPIQALKTIFAKRRIHPRSLVPKGGSAWWALPIETIVEIVSYLKKHPGFLEYHRYTHVPDETIFHTLVDELNPTENMAESVTYVNWKRKGVTLPVTFHKTEDFKELMALEDRYLFARKFDDSINSDILDRLDRYLSNEGVSE